MSGQGNLPENTGIPELEWHIMEEAALGEEARGIDELEQLKASAFAGYGGSEPSKEAFLGKLQAMYPDRELPDRNPGEALYDYTQRVSQLFKSAEGNDS